MWRVDWYNKWFLDQQKTNSSFRWPVFVLSSTKFNFLALLFLIHNLLNCFKSKCKLFADDTYLFFAAHDVNSSASDINLDLKLISDWVFQWKISFKPDRSKQAQEIHLAEKNEVIPPKGYFNNILVSSTSVYRHLGMLLDDRLSYIHHLKFVLHIVKKTIGLLCKF